MVTKGQKLGLTYADHYPLIIRLEMPKSDVEAKPEARWNVNKPGAWEMYEKVSDEAAEKIEELAEDENMTNEGIMKYVDKLENKIKYKTFGKTKPRTKQKTINETKDNNSEEESAKVLAKRHLDKMEEAIARIQKLRQGRCGKVFKMRDEIAGPRKAGKEAHAIIDFRTNELVVSNYEIKKVT